VKHYRGGDARDYGQHEKYVRPECEVSPKQRAAMETPEAQAVITTLDRRGVPYEFKHHEAEDEITAFVGDQLFQIENLGLPRQDLIVETISDELLMFVRRHGFTVWQVNQ
jgi:hypothetical protein